MKGFSLIELMVVVTVLLSLTLLILPQFGGTFQGELLRAAGRELAATIHLAYSQAVTSQRSHRLRIDPRKGRFWIEAYQGEGQGAGFSPARDLPGSRGEIDPRISIEVKKPGAREGEGAALADGSPEGPAEAIPFRPDGTTEAREILLEDAEGFQLALRLQAATARVRITDRGRKGAP